MLFPQPSITLFNLGPWINNCVGYFNHAHFIRMLVFSAILFCTALTVLCVRMPYLLYLFFNSDRVRAHELFFTNMKHQTFNLWIQCFFNVSNFAIAVLLGFVSISLLTEQLPLISTNSTFIDELQLKDKRKVVLRGS